MNAEQIIAKALGGSDYANWQDDAIHAAAALREAGIDLDHTYEEAPVTDYSPFFRGGEPAGMKAVITLLPADNVCPLVAFVRRPLGAGDE